MKQPMQRALMPLGRLRFWPISGIIAGAFLFWVMGRVSGVDFALWQLILVAVAALLAAGLISALKPNPVAPPELYTRQVNTPTWRPFLGINRWEDQFIFAEAKPGRFEGTAAKRRMVELVAERLRLRHGLALEANAAQCRELLGEDFYRFLTQPVPDCPGERQLNKFLQTIEEI